MKLSKNIPLVIFGGFFLVPFLFSNYFYDPFEYPKVLAVRVLIELLFFYYLIFCARKYSFRWDFYDFLGIFWIVILLGSSFSAGNFNWSFWGGGFRFQGIFTYLHLIALFIISRRLFDQSEKLAKFVLKLLIIGSTIEALLIILQFSLVKFFGSGITTYSGRPIGTLGQPGFAGGFLAAGFALSLGFYISKKSKKYLTSSLILLAGILAVKSLGAILAVVVVIFLILIKKSPNIKTKILSGAFLFLVLLGFLKTGLIKEKITVNSYGQPRIESRLSIWPASFKLFLARPLVGYGSENLGQVFPDKYGGRAIDRAHNALLDRLLEGGIFLGIIYLIFAFSGLYYALMRREIFPVFLAFSASLVMEQVNVSGIVNLFCFFILLAMLMKPDYR